MQESKMSIQRKLETARYILLRVAENPDCAKITGYSKMAIECFVEGIDAVLKRYKNEATRTRKYPKFLNMPIVVSNGIPADKALLITPPDEKGKRESVLIYNLGPGGTRTGKPSSAREPQQS